MNRFSDMSTFVAVVESGSFSEAARRLGTAKAIVTRKPKRSRWPTTDSGKAGNRVTHFGRAMYELNIDTFCANSSSAKGRVEHASLTLQDGLVSAVFKRRWTRRKRPARSRHGSSTPCEL
ncbi:hypothetical protein WL77_15435 [Burkholderia ubonensis]|nr:hypothetical protein WL79_30450 [Burkholderia ubonensis]KWE67074.1 hypothetical protein WL77_15435 [Burkholderia ubonensis]